MINWFDMPAEGLSNGGQFEIKELTATENKVYQKDGEVYNKVTVNVEGGGGGSWQTVFEGSVTTVEGEESSYANVTSAIINADTIKVTFNGVEYTCNKIMKDDTAYYGGFDGADFDFSNYPFCLQSGVNPFEGVEFTDIITPTAGTYTLKIEEQQSGGGDFSTAEVTFSGTDGTLASMPLIISTPFDAILPMQNSVNDETYTIALYKGKAIISLELGLGQNVTTSGAIELLEGFIYTVTGDCTITITTE